MAKTQIVLHFHAEDPFGPILESARLTGQDASIRDSAPFDDPGAGAGRLPQVIKGALRLSDGLGVPVLLSLSNACLVRALGDRSERKALTEGVSRGRLLPTPTPAFGADLATLAAFECADELRLNIDLWKRAVIAPPIGELSLNDTRMVISSNDPASQLSSLPTGGGAKRLVLGIDLNAVARNSDPAAALAALANDLRNRNNIRPGSPTSHPSGYCDQLLGDVLGSGGRYPRFFGRDRSGFDAVRDGFPLELARKMADDSLATRSLAGHGAELVDADFDLARVSPNVARGVLLRVLTRSAGCDGIPHLDRLRASFLVAAHLLESIDVNATDGANEPADQRQVESATRIANPLQAEFARCAEQLGEGTDAKLVELRDQLDQLESRARAILEGGCTVAELHGACRDLTFATLPLLSGLRELSQSKCGVSA